MKKSMQVRAGSVKRAGLPKDYKEALKQYIWNSIEAGATDVDIIYESDKDLPSIQSLSIEDNGTGIVFEDLESTFGAFLDSDKQSRFTKGGKGKGRLSFLCFSSKAVWYTTYTGPDNKNYFHTVEIEANDSQNYEQNNEPKQVDQPTGTKVEFRMIHGDIGADKLNSEEFEQFLSLEFGWYLEVFGNERIVIKRNGEKLNYKKYIEDTDSMKFELSDDKTPKNTYDFKVNYIRWSEKIGTESYFYFLTNNRNLVDRKTTGFNTVGGRAYGFVHSLFITSDYFGNFAFTNTSDDNLMLDLDNLSLDQKDQIYKQLIRRLKPYVESKRDEFLKKDSEKAIERFAERQTLPVFGNDPLSKSQEEDYLQVLKGMYKTVPTLFINLHEQQEKSLLGLLNLTLKTDERESVIDILSQVVDLKPEERKELAELLKNAKLSGVIKLLKTLEARYEVVELLRKLVYEHKKDATERNQLQAAIESNCWLFGEEYNMIGADSSFAKLRRIYLEFIESTAKDKNDLENRRPDIFITRSNKITSGISSSTNKIHNLIIELKRPSVTIGTMEYRQIEDYRNIIRGDSSFKSDLREWHMYLIGVDIEEEIRVKRDELKYENRQFLVNKEGEFYIYALTWAEVFDSFEVRHDYLLSDLKIDKSKVAEDLQHKQDLETPQQVANKVVDIGKKILATSRA